MTGNSAGAGGSGGGGIAGGAGGAGGDGGGIYSNAGSVTISRSTITGNATGAAAKAAPVAAVVLVARAGTAVAGEGSSTPPP